MGTPEFSVPCLQKLFDENYEVVGVYTQPDKPKGRGYVLTPPPVKELALKYNVPVFQPQKMRDEETVSALKSLNPDVIVVVAYGKILPKEILDIPPMGCINVHASLLPKYRGAGPIQWSVINGETKTGVTTMYMDVGLDTGDQIIDNSIIIGENDTAGEVHDKLSLLGAETLIETLKLVQNGTAPRTKQDDSLATYAPMLDKNLCEIDFSKDAREIHNLIRGLSPWPVATTKLNGKTLKIHRSLFINKNVDATPGEVIENNERLVVACKKGCIEILQLQLEGKKRMDTTDFLRGHPVEIKTVLG
jgi:methionyl-tRNA formyltransferase